MRPLRSTFSTFLIAAGTGAAAAQPPAAVADPATAEVPLAAAPGWQARLVFAAGVGVWTVACGQVQPQFGCPEILAMDDRGRCTVLRSYSGKWTPQPTVEDGKWLAPVAWGELDQTLDGLEIYTGGQGGRLWQIHPRPSAHFDCRVVGEWPGEEIHTLVVDDLDPTHPGDELLVFLAGGGVHLGVAGGPGAHAPGLRQVATLPGRVRQAVVLAAAGGEPPAVVAVSRAGLLSMLRLRGDHLDERVLASEPMGLGRIAAARDAAGGTVLYVTRDDGLILRFAGALAGPLQRSVVYAGPQGPRGIVSGRFGADPARECVAVFGYSREVELLSRLPGEAWQRETVFTDSDKGHWLTAAELDGRNGTDELIGSGYSGRVFLLSRPPGYGLPAAAVPVAAAGAAADAEPARPLRVGLRARAGGAANLTSLSYRGGFEPKTLHYETLVRAGADGATAPGLAASWRIAADGCSIVFELRAGARFHDGEAVTAEAVREHFKRWVGLPEHDWLPANRRIVDVVAESARTLRITTDRPWALLPELCAVNPCAVVAPGARDREGAFAMPVGSGPFRFVAELDPHRWRVQRVDADDAPPLEVVVFPRHGEEPVDALLRGELDVFVGGWDDDLPAARLRDLAADPALRVVRAPGSSVVSLGFRLAAGPTADPAVRRRIAAAVVRSELIRRAEGGEADPCTAWAAPAVGLWPRSEPGVLAVTAGGDDIGAPVRLTIDRGASARAARVAALVAEQLERAGFEVVPASAAGAPCDLRVEVSHGVPYDPHITLVRRFGPDAPAAAGVPDELRTLVAAAAGTPSEAERLPLYARIEAILRRDVLMVPLYAPRRVALHHASVAGLDLGLDLYRVDLTALRRVDSR